MAKQTLYQKATEEMLGIIPKLLELSTKTKNFTSPPNKLWNDELSSKFLLGGQGYDIRNLPTVSHRKNAWLARSAILFSLEHAATGVLYEKLQPFIESMIKTAYEETKNFTDISAEWVFNNSHLLPVIMHAIGTFSKQQLTSLIGSVSDRGLSKPASERLSALCNKTALVKIAKPSQIIERIKATTEGIVRDLVGRLLLEEFVARSLVDAKIPFLRENQYENFSGVVYDFRADFVIPDEIKPKAFIEVRKSSSRHSSLYAKDKMFSAINWKGKHPECLGVIVTDGMWTGASLDVMARVFDYVIPIGQVSEVAKIIRRYVDGDNDALRWIIHFRIDENN